MSSGSTHLLIGAAAGVAAARWAGLALTIAPSSVMGWSVVVSSALLATLPDRDSGSRFIAQRFRLACRFLAAALGALLGVVAVQRGWLLALSWIPPHTRHWVLPLAGALIGALLVGPLLGSVLLRVIRVGAGGHRRLTHSGVVAAVLGLLAWWLWQQGLVGWALVPGCLAYAIIVHDIGDVVTTAGVPLLYPLSSMRFGLPRPLARYGEPLIATASVLIGVFFLTQPT